jgi:hypothetical protein
MVEQGMSTGRLLIILGLALLLVTRICYFCYLEGRRSVRGGQCIIVSFGKDGTIIETKTFEKDGTWDPPKDVGSVLVLAWSAEYGWRPARHLRPSAPGVSFGLNGGGAASSSPFPSPKSGSIIKPKDGK